jgi:rubrerythrin
MDKKITLIAPVFTKESVSASMNRLYAAKLKKEKNAILAKLFDSIASAEEIHTRRMLMHLRSKIGNIDDYVNQLLESKMEALTTDFPQIAEILPGIGSKQAVEIFAQFGKVAKNHYDLLLKIKDEGLKESVDYFVCSVCGYIAEDSPPEKCPVCGAVHGKFKKEE